MPRRPRPILPTPLATALVLAATVTGAVRAAPVATPENLLPPPPTLTEPVDEGMGETPVAHLTVSVSDPDGDPLDVSFYGRKLPDGEPDFTLIVIPDTQYYVSLLAGGSPAILDAQTQWIVDAMAERNIAAVIQTGD